MENFELIEDTQVYEMPNGEFIRVWNDGDLYGDDSELKEDFESYFDENKSQPPNNADEIVQIK